jgi:hypothetical protein
MHNNLLNQQKHLNIIIPNDKYNTVAMMWFIDIKEFFNFIVILAVTKLRLITILPNKR